MSYLSSDTPTARIARNAQYDASAGIPFIVKDETRQTRHGKLKQGNTRQRHDKDHNNKTREDKEYGPDIALFCPIPLFTTINNICPIDFDYLAKS
jgi:hypothetical protein